MPDLSEEERIEIAQESQEKFVELVEGDVDRGEGLEMRIYKLECEDGSTRYAVSIDDLPWDQDWSDSKVEEVKA